MTKICSGFEKDFILDTLIKKNILLKNQDSSCVLAIVKKANNQILTAMHSNERDTPESGTYTALLDRVRTVTLVLTYKSHENPYHVFLLPETIAIQETPLKTHKALSIELICTLGHEQLELSVSKQTPFHAHSCIIFSEILTREPSMYASVAQQSLPTSTHISWYGEPASLPTLARIAQETNKLIIFDYKYGIPETACCVGNRLLLRDDFETIVKNSSRQTQDALKQELKQIALQQSNLCLYPLSYLHENFSDIAMWSYQNLPKRDLLATIHQLDAVVLKSVCRQRNKKAMVLGMFIHGILCMLDTTLTTTAGTCLIAFDKRRLRGTITLSLLSQYQTGALYYGQFSAFEPEDFRYLAEYILKKPLSDEDVGTEEFKTICSL